MKNPATYSPAITPYIANTRVRSTGVIAVNDRRTSRPMPSPTGPPVSVVRAIFWVISFAASVASTVAPGCGRSRQGQPWPVPWSAIPGRPGTAVPWHQPRRHWPVQIEAGTQGLQAKQEVEHDHRTGTTRHGGRAHAR